MADLTIPKSDKGFYLNFTITDDDGSAFDLTDYTVTLKVWTQSKPAALIVDAAGSIVSATDGTCRYLVTASDFTIAGEYYFEVELTKTGVIISTKRYTLEVTESE